MESVSRINLARGQSPASSVRGEFQDPHIEKVSRFAKVLRNCRHAAQGVVSKDKRSKIVKELDEGNRKIDNELVLRHIQECSEMDLRNPWDPNVLVTNFELIHAMEAIVLALPKNSNLRLQVESFSMIRMSAELLQVADQIANLAEEFEEAKLDEIKIYIEEIEKFFLSINMDSFLRGGQSDKSIFELGEDNLNWQDQSVISELDNNICLEHVNLTIKARKKITVAVGCFEKVIPSFYLNPERHFEEFKGCIQGLKDAFRAAIGDDGIQNNGMWDSVMTTENMQILGINL